MCDNQIKKKRGVFISPDTSYDSPGVRKKIQNQIMALSSYFEIHQVLIPKKTVCILSKIKSILPYGSMQRDYELALNEIKRIAPIDFVYIRISPLDREYVRFLQRIRKEYPKCKILVEQPTFPYDRSLLINKTMWPWFFKDRNNRKHVAKCIDRFVVYGDYESIFGVPTIQIINGIDIKEGMISENDEENDAQTAGYCSSRIRLIAVAQFQPSHGYERLIRSLYLYYKNGGDRDISIDMVGYGSEMDYYRKLTEHYHLEDKVFFHAPANEEQLRAFYRNSDIGLGSFGAYKMGLNLSSALKIREYLINGLPIVSGCVEDVFRQNPAQFYLQFANSPSDIEIEQIISFLDNLYNKDKEIVRKQIIDYAIQNVDIRKTFKPITDWIING